MDKINIDTLFPTVTGERRQHTGGKIDINTMFKNAPQLITKKEEFESTDLLQSIENNRKKRLKVIIDYYNLCCKMIKDTDANGQNKMTFSIAKKKLDVPGYSPVEVLEYIVKNLRAKFIDALIISQTSIFVSWKNLEINMEEDKQRTIDN